MNDRTRDYVFISYSHANNIDDIIKKFSDKGYNVVYDAAMSYGEEWDLNARRYIRNEKCKGVIFVLSDKALVSKAILTEIGYTVHFQKKFFSLMLHNLTLMELYSATSKNLDENKLYVLNCIMEYLNAEQLFVPVANINWERIKTTFATWNFYPDDTGAQKELITTKYTSEMAGEKERLARQAQGYYDFDMRAISQVVNEFGRDHLTVLDLGCSNGALTISRFADDPKVYKVIGVDYNQADIDEANQLAAIYGNKFCFYRVDLEDENIIAQLTQIMRENNIEKMDIVFAALVLHHLNNPNLLLLRLYDIFRDDGKIIIRGSDDGGKLCFPHTDLLQEILSRYNKVVATSDRTNGRKLYNQLYNTGYVGIKMFYSIVDTCEKSRKDKENMYRVGFGFRLNTLDRLISLNPDNVHLKEERDWLGQALIKLQQAFCERDFWYCNTSYIAIAGVK